MTIPYHTTKVLKDADAMAAKGDLSRVYDLIRTLTLADFCNLHIDPLEKFPNLAKILPQMPAEEVQTKWVGDSGKTLMARSCNLARLFDLISYRVTGSGLKDKFILDYGCGYGRLLRIMNFYSPVERVHGVDPMQLSLDHCAEGNIPNELKMIATRPESLPLQEKRYDFAFAFSVFSHTPASVTSAVLQGLRPYMSDNSVFVATIRSVEWVSVRDGNWPDETCKSMRDSFYTDGYAFQTFKTSDSLHEQDYGDTIMSVEYVDALAKKVGWKVAVVDRDLSEPFQIAVGFVPI